MHFPQRNRIAPHQIRVLGMVVLSQKRGASIVLSGGITVKVVNIRRRRVWIGITAPKEIKIRREPGPASTAKGD